MIISFTFFILYIQLNCFIRQPKENEIINEKKQENRKKAEEFLLQANENQFNCANPEKSIKTKVCKQSFGF